MRTCGKEGREEGRDGERREGGVEVGGRERDT